MYFVPNKIIEIGRKLRKDMTNSEKMIWNELKNNKLGVKFLRQNPMYVYTENSGLDRFIIPDFYCKDKKLIIEIDGSIHDIDEVFKLDRYKEKLITQKGMKILRFRNEEVENNLSNIINKIKLYL